MSPVQQVIYSKLEAFIRKYHTSELIKGMLLFLGIGILYFLCTLAIEHIWWLSPTNRTILFVSFVVVEVVLFLFFILKPLFRLFKLRGGLNHEQAAVIIGAHFSEVADSLLNFLQLSAGAVSQSSSELIEASIEQKATRLQLVPFTQVVKHSKNIIYVPIAIIALSLIAYLLWLPNNPVLSNSLNRFMAYNKPFVAPAPFYFSGINSNMRVQQGNDFTINFTVEGKMLPDMCRIELNDQLFYAQKLDANTYSYTFKNIESSLSFQLIANEVVSQPYAIEVIEVPVVANFSMKFTYPNYLKKPSEIVSGTGNAQIPEGTMVEWNLQTVATDSVYWQAENKRQAFNQNQEFFLFKKKVIESVSYRVKTSNQHVKNYENLEYSLQVYKDAYPKITCNFLPDSLRVAHQAVIGQVSDDYGIKSLHVLYHPAQKPNQIKSHVIPVKKDDFDQFYFVLSQAVSLEEGVVYHYYFEVHDNDGVNGSKATRSETFSFNSKSQNEIEQENLSNQSESIADIKSSLEDQKQQLKQLDKLERLSKEKNRLDYEDKLRVKDFAEKQKAEQDLMKNFAKELQQNLSDFKTKEKDPLKEELIERLEKSQKDIEQNKKLLDELSRLNDQIKQEDLTDKLEKLKQNNKSQSKSLEQLLELTKKFYVEKKVEQLAQNLEQLSEKQKELSTQNSTQNEQQKINQEFNKIKEELQKVGAQNKELKAPVSMPDNSKLEQAIDQDLKQSEADLKNNDAQKAKPKQKAASDKMKEMSESLKESMEAGEAEQLQEDAAMLRQIMDNLLTYSFSQEKLLSTFKTLKKGSPSYPKHLKSQQFLKAQFKHIDDSLFVLSMRNPVISDIIIKEIGSVYYNTDQAMDSFAETQIEKGISHQQYIMSSTNILADLLSNALQNMQMQMASSSGKGKPKPGGKSKGDKQLEDIMKSQEGISKKIQKGKGESEQEGQSGKPKSGGSGSEGMSGEIFEIYKQQQQLRQQLEQMLQKNGMGGNGNSTINHMKALEKQLLNKGFTKEAMTQSQQLKVELLKLEQALKKQGEDTKRQANSAKDNFRGKDSSDMPASVQEYMKSIEILNRDKLPLTPLYNSKLQIYFNSND